ncbi:MAG: DUF4294 domain-containing protein [Bacteroidaceae bacterium]|nr:DUF4294 domain-containing protein [Bacteroidaceae bacterium]
MIVKHLIVSLVGVFSFCISLYAQEEFDDNFKGRPFRSAVNQTWYWVNDDYVYEGERIWTVLMPEYTCYAPMKFKNEKERKKYNRLVYNVRRVLPLAQEVNRLISETYVVLEKLPTAEAKQKHIKMVEKEIMNRYKPEMKKLTYSQGKLMIKLVDRQCKQSGYEVVKAFLGPTRAAFYQMFAWTFNASLKKKYDAEGDDRLIERICVELEQGTL